MITLNIDTNSPDQSGLVPDFRVSGTGSVGEYFSQDALMALWIRPVVASLENPLIPWVDDYLLDDVLYIAIGNVDDRATGGTFTLTLTGAIAAQAYNVTAAALQAALSARSVTDGYGALTVSLLTEGVYQVDWTTAIAVPAMTASATLLTPESQITIAQVRAGSVSTYAQQIIDIKQTAIATATLSTEYAEVSTSATLSTAPSLTANAIWTFNFGTGYNGFATPVVTANGVVSSINVTPYMTAEEFGQALALHPSIYFQDPTVADNVSVAFVNGAFLVTFIGTLAGSTTARTISAISIAAAAVVTTSAAHGYVTGNSVVISGTLSTPTIDGTRVITVLSTTTFSVPVTTTVGGSAGSCYNISQPTLTAADTDVVYAKGYTGTLNLNTFALAKQFWSTTEDELTFSLQIVRDRAAGEIQTIFGQDVTLKRELIDVGSLINVPTIGLNSLTLGAVGVATGTLLMKGTTSGTVTITTAAAAGTWTLTLPTSDGNPSQVLITDGAGVTSWSTNGVGTVTEVSFTGGLISVATAQTTPAFTVAGTSGGIPYFSGAATWASSAALTANSLVKGGGAGFAPSTITTGTGVLTALGVNTGSAGAMVLFNGALGTPSSGTLTSATGLPIATGVSGLGTNVATALATPTNANLYAAFTDLYLDNTVAIIDEDFIGGTNSDGSIGQLGWRLFSIAGTNSTTYVLGTANNPGQFQFACGASSGNAGCMTLLGSSLTPFLMGTATWELRITFKLNQTTLTRFRLGMLNDQTAVVPGRLECLRYDTSLADTNFMFVISDGGGETAVSSGVAVDTNWHTLRIRTVTPGSYIYAMSMNTSGGAFGSETQVTNTGVGVTRSIMATIGNDATAAAKSFILDAVKLRWICVR